MSTVHEIETAIRSLAPAEREELVNDLPRLLPELDGDAAWERIARDPRPRPAFSALVDELQAAHRRDLKSFPEITATDFDKGA